MSVLFIANETFIEVPLLREIAPAMKNSWLHPCILSDNFSEIERIVIFQTTSKCLFLSYRYN